MTEMLEFDFTETPTDPPAGNPHRFTDRWHLVRGGLSNVWRFGDLDLPAPTGRLLLRGPNGTGKTTALEALWPYLLDLDAQKLSAGKSRTTTLKQLMSEGAENSGRRYGYAWLTFAPPSDADEPEFATYGVRLQYSPNSSPAVKVVPFTVPARPVQGFSLQSANGSALEHDDFAERITGLGGDLFESADAYVDHLALRIWSTSAQQVKELAQRMRQVRNPSLLGEVSPAQAAEALRESLPGVASDDITATADALAESETTRDAFERDRRAAEVLDDFAKVWTGHVVEVANMHLSAAKQAADEVALRNRSLRRAETNAAKAVEAATVSEQHARELESRVKDQVNLIRAIEQSEEYKTAGFIKELAKRLNAEQESAKAAVAALTSAARAAASRTDTAEVALDIAVEQLDHVLDDVRAASVAVRPRETLLAHHRRPRQFRVVADATIDPGSELVVTHNAEALSALADDWLTQANRLQAEAGTASILVAAYVDVDRALTARTEAAQALQNSEGQYQAEQQTLDTATDKARRAVTTLLEQVASWLEQHHTLRAADPNDPTSGFRWDTEDIAELIGSEPASVLEQTEHWAADAMTTAERLAAGHEAKAKLRDARASELKEEAKQSRTSAQALREGALLPFPRPDWASDGDDQTALGSLLEWQPGVEGVRDRLEMALTASGLLTAQLDAGTAEASTPVWRVSAAGPKVDRSLMQVLSVDSGRTGADVARAVLARIRLADTAVAGESSLVIGLDGSFAAGVLVGDPAAAALAKDGEVPAAGFVGARTRRERALAEAKRMESRATELEGEADAEQSAADDARSQARTARADGRSFPNRNQLQTAEAERATAAQRTQIAKTRRDEDEGKADKAATEHQSLHDDWSSRARNLGMPADVDQLNSIATDRRRLARSLDNWIRDLRSLTTALPRRLGLLDDEDELSTQLAGLEAKARGAVDVADTTAALLEEVRRDSDATDAVRRHQEATREHERLTSELTPAQERASKDRTNAAEAKAKIEPAGDALKAAIPERANTEGLLSTLLKWPPAAAALDIPGYLATTGHEPSADVPEGNQLLEFATALLDRKATSARRTLNERYDEVRADLAQTWTLAHSDAPEGLNLESYILTHADEEYDLPRAARKAMELAAHAEAALAVADERALHDLVIGRLPTAIGIAWQKMHDWKNEVNAKMRSARASSGVGVQVRITLRDDLDAATSTAHHLSCEVSTAVRTEEQKEQVGSAIRALLAAADGDTMTERLASAVDIRSWVDVRYMIERPDGSGNRSVRVWGPRAGLSGGERRLVVFAPMLAAIAAGYDRLDASGLRLVPLDEVPAEVDERGREGLARYMAELDLDLICTSYLWDGAPGAWDGIDAHDLEAGSSGTVVAFPTLVRGLGIIPGDVVGVTASEA